MPLPVAVNDLARSIVERFDAIAVAYARKTAIQSPRAAISYDELKARSEAIARFVRESVSAAPMASPVVILLPQGIDAIAAQLGVLRAGAFYVPADVREAVERLRTLIEHVGASLVIGNVQSTARAAAALGERVEVVDIARIPVAMAHSAEHPHAAPDALAYVYYTSGSTGAPKGVADTHRNVIHNVLRYTLALKIGPDDRLTLLQPPSFSGAVSSTYAALLNGGTVLPYDLHEDGPEDLARFIADSAATIYHSVPAIFRNFVAGRAEFPAMRYVRLEGDRALGRDARLFQQHFTPGCRLVNGLGTTETGLVRQYFVTHDTAVDDGPLPIGYPVEGVECLVVDESGSPVESGEVGEIVVAGEYLAKGYWRDEALTRRKFVQHGSIRRYRTGDFGRMRADGCLEYLGRSEAEPRIRGVSVDRAAVEQALLRVPGVLDAAVVTVETSQGELALMAAVAAQNTTPAALQQALRTELPSQAIPARIVLCDALPLTPFGKVDRAAIARSVFASEAKTESEPAHHDEVERRVADIWKAVLGVPALRAGESFLAHGGDSLQAMQVVMRVRDAFGVGMSPEDFFAVATVAEQARFLRRTLGERAGSASVDASAEARMSAAGPIERLPR